MRTITLALSTMFAAPADDNCTLDQMFGNECTASRDSSAEAPSAEAPSAEAPSAEAPSAEAPSAEAPSAEAPSAEAPSAEAPSAEAPSAEAPSAEAPSAEAPSAEAPSADELELDAKALVGAGKLAEAIPLYERAYDLAPGHHLIGYEIGMAAWELGDCDKARLYLRHFTKYADANTFRHKRVKAAEALAEIDYRGCTAHEQEVNEASSAVARPKPRDSSDALLAVGSVMAAFGGIGFVSGNVLIGLWATGRGATTCTTGTPCGQGCISVGETCNLGSTLATSAGKPSFLISGAVLIPVGIGMLVGGIVMAVRGSQPDRLTVGPTGISVRF